MSDINGLTRRILRGLCADVPDEEERALINYGRTAFGSLQLTGVYGRFLEMLLQFYQLKSGPPSTTALSEHAEQLREREVISLAQELAVQPHDWGSSYVDLLDRYRENVAETRLRQLLQEAAQIADDGLTRDRQPTLRGVKDALQHMTAEGVAIHQYLSDRQQSLSSDQAEERMIGVYHQKRARNEAVYGATGYATIDAVTRGGHPGELWFVGGYAKQGKSTFCTNWARYLALEGGWNVYYVTLEMPAEDIWEIFYASQSAHPKWGRRPLLRDEIVAGRFADPADEAHYLQRVMRDFSRPNSGCITVERPSGSMTVQSIWSRAEVANRTRPLDMIVIDYLTLLDPPKYFENKGIREILTENIKQAKNMSLEFDRGTGVLVVLPHQMSRDGLLAAQKKGGQYELRAFAETAEVERSADVVLTIYRDDEMERNNEALICHLANRKGKLAEPFRAYAPFQYGYIADQRSGNRRNFLVEA